MDVYQSYNDKSSKEDLEKVEFDSNTTYSGEGSSNEEGAAFLPYTTARKNMTMSRGRHLRLLSSPIFVVTAILSILSLLAMNISTLVILHQQSSNDEAHNMHPHDGLLNSHTSLGQGESVSPEGLRVAPNGQILECGEDSRDAEANGCIFDIMSFEWTPPACYDEAMLLDTIDPNSPLAPSIAGNFPWYRHANFTEPVEQKAELLSTFSYIWTSGDWHRGHCLYMWRVLVKALNRVLDGEKEIYVPAGATSWAHIAHCNLLISDKTDGAIIPLEAFRTVTTCVRLDKPDGLGAQEEFGGL